MGDEVQALKAGLLEIADILVVNKSDRPGAARTARALEMVIMRNAVQAEDDEEVWHPLILQTIALDGTGVPELLEAIEAHREHLHSSGTWAERERERAKTELLNVLRETLLDRLLAQVGEEQLQEWTRRITAREVDVYTASRAMVEVS